MSRNDHHRKRTGYPSICMAMAVLLKERNREMSGLQYLMSLLLFASHTEKKKYFSSKYLVQYILLVVVPSVTHVYTLLYLQV